ncbi:MAG: transposase [Chryseobacterium sp.]|nr:transposase [Chryseobacterium sp.]
MKKSTFSSRQIAEVLKEFFGWMQRYKLARKNRISPATLYTWRQNGSYRT